MNKVYTRRSPRICAEPGCERLTGKGGVVKGHQIYKKWCQTHRKDPHPLRSVARVRGNYSLSLKQLLRKDACERCGWDEAICDLHRIEPGGAYTADNVITLCPNCHRVETVRLQLQNGYGGI